MPETPRINKRMYSFVGRVSDSVTRQSHCGNHAVGATNSPRITDRMYWANLSPLQSSSPVGRNKTI